ncbi:MAG: elongation factor P maturation arginine rhamnosyltransferase EarP, partial [Comamonadaceae bacterium]
MTWDIFCKVIDNHGDAGVCWRLAAELAARGDAVRLWIDDPSLLAWMAPGGRTGVQVIEWTDAPPDLAPGEVVVEAFGCDPPPAFVARMAAAVPPPAWINLEYLSAEPYVERNHGLPSPVGSGPGAGLVKRFFYPGFTARTGGLLREQDLAQRRAAFDPQAWLRDRGITSRGGRTLSLFCYEPPALADLLHQLAADDASPTDLLVTAGRATAATLAASAGLDTERPGWNAAGRLRLHWLPLLSQRDYDHLLWACDCNVVRGEDSLARALVAGKPFLWQLYPQDDGAHLAKLEAFLDWLRPPPDLALAFRAWNGATGLPLPRLDL